VKRGFENGKEGIIMTDVLTTFWQELGKYEPGNLEHSTSLSSIQNCGGMFSFFISSLFLTNHFFYFF
jgi:hypothetical protein